MSEEIILTQEEAEAVLADAPPPSRHGETRQALGPWNHEPNFDDDFPSSEICAQKLILRADLFDTPDRGRHLRWVILNARIALATPRN